MLGVSRSSNEPKPGPLVLLVRWGLPIALVIAGIVMLVMSGGHLTGVQDNASESNVFTTIPTDRDSMLSALGVAAIVIALMVWLLNWLLRMNADEAGDRKDEEDAREHLRRTGHWPDDD
ncbi:MAG: DUF3185 family protein [Solirubrobacteraceae bacterium]